MSLGVTDDFFVMCVFGGEALLPGKGCFDIIWERWNVYLDKVCTFIHKNINKILLVALFMIG